MPRTIPTTDLTSAGAQRAAMALGHYGGDQPLAELLADLADYCREAALSPLHTIALFAEARADRRRRPDPSPAARGDAKPELCAADAVRRPGEPLVFGPDDDLYDVLEALEREGFGGAQ